jgi:hypothetical protein
VLHGSQEILGRFLGDPWIQFCNGGFEVVINFFNDRRSLIDGIFISYYR